MLAGEVPVHRYEAITDMCPPSLCEAQRAEPLDRALHDAAVVYGHRVLPAGLREDLPSIDQAWGGFDGPTEGTDGTDADARAVFETGRLARWAQKSEIERSPANQADRLVDQIEAVDGEPALHFVHVVLPHAPWVISPWGPALMADPPGRIDDPDDPAYEWSSRLSYQRHALQVGAADVALGKALDHLEALASWEDTTLVVIADHGTSILPPDFGREPTPRNVQELYRVPLFLKAPGQTRGAIVDDPAQAIDLVPTLADLLDADLDWDFDGHSLLDGSRATEEPLVGEDLEPLFDLVRRHDEQVAADGDWASLAAVGAHARSVGERLSTFALGPPSDLAWQPDFEDDFASLPTDDGRAPQVLTGTVTAPDGRPPELVVSVNGTIGGVLGGYVDAGGGTWRFATVLGPFLRDGANEIRAFELVGGELRPLD
jgi:hypothetical protein